MKIHLNFTSSKFIILLLFLISLSYSTTRNLHQQGGNYIDWTTVIKNCKYGVYTAGVPRCVQCQWGFRLDIEQRSCVQNVWYCAEYGRQNQSQCAQCIQGYVLGDNFCYKNLGVCEKYNYINDTCVQCISTHFMQNNQCIPIPCQSGQYRNYDGICVSGDIAGCQQYFSPSGACEICQLGFWKDPSTNQCITKPVCPANNNQFSYVIEFNQCKKVQTVCEYWVGESCGACKMPYYLINGVCIIIPGF